MHEEGSGTPGWVKLGQKNSCKILCAFCGLESPEIQQFFNCEAMKSNESHLLGVPKEYDCLFSA